VVKTKAVEGREKEPYPETEGKCLPSIGKEELEGQTGTGKKNLQRQILRLLDRPKGEGVNLWEKKLSQKGRERSPSG